MDITVPKNRNQAWREFAPSQLSRYEGAARGDIIKFKDYCALSRIFINAADSVFHPDSNFKRFVDLLINPSVVYNLSSKKEQPKTEQARTEEMIAERIAKALSYAWKYIVDLIRGREKDHNDKLGIYKEDNIGLQFARLEGMLKELESNKHRVQLYSKENAYVREMMEKEMEEEITFIKLLQNILSTQTQRIRDNRAGKAPPEISPQPQEQEEQEEEKLPDIREVVKVNEYFSRKVAKWKEGGQENTTKDLIDLQQEKRQFNAAAMRYHLQQSQSRR